MTLQQNLADVKSLFLPALNGASMHNPLGAGVVEYTDRRSINVNDLAGDDVCYPRIRVSGGSCLPSRTIFGCFEARLECAKRALESLPGPLRVVYPFSSKERSAGHLDALNELHPDLVVGIDSPLTVEAKEVDFLAVAQAFEGVSVLRGARKSPVLRSKALSEGGDLVKLASGVEAAACSKFKLLAEADFEALIPFGDDDVHGITLSQLEVAVKGVGVLNELYPDLLVGAATVTVKEADFLAVAQANNWVAVFHGAFKDKQLFTACNGLFANNDQIKLAVFVQPRIRRQAKLLTKVDSEVFIPTGNDNIHAAILSPSGVFQNLSLPLRLNNGRFRCFRFGVSHVAQHNLDGETIEAFINGALALRPTRTVRVP